MYKGKVVTFYSYKGGTGRSMALANIAVLLARWGKKTLVVDWDLEAPGLEEFFREYCKSAQFGERVGISELLFEMSQNPSDPNRIALWKKAVITLRLDDRTAKDGSVTVDFIGAGKRDSGKHDSLKDYFRTVRRFDAEEFYKNEGLDRIEELRTEWIKAYDFVLVDSRTGVTDISSICTAHLPDLLVVLFTPTIQALNGTVSVGRSAIREFENLLLERFSYYVMPVASRFDFGSESESSQRWLIDSANEVDEFYREWAKETAALDILRMTCIPYMAFSSFGENLLFAHESGDNPASMSYAYTNIAALLARDLESVDQLIGDREGYLRPIRPPIDMRGEMGDEQWQHLGKDVFIMSPPAIGQNEDGRLQVFARGSNGALVYLAEEKPGSDSWREWRSLEGDVYEPRVASNVDGRLEVFVKGPRGDLWHRWQMAPNSDHWNDEWMDLGGILHSPPAVARDAKGRLAVFMCGSDSALWYRSQREPGSREWTSWTSLGGDVSEPRVKSNADGRLEVFAVYNDGSLWHIWQIEPQTDEWSNWSSLSGLLQSAPAVGRNSDGRLEVFVRGTDGILWHKSQRRPGADLWGRWRSQSQGVQDLQVIEGADGRLSVFVIGNENALWYVQQDSQPDEWGKWQRLGGVLLDYPVPFVNEKKRIQVFVHGTDGALWRRFADS